MKDLSKEEIIQLAAQIAHEANRAFARTQADNSHKHWEDADENQRISSISGVESAFLAQRQKSNIRRGWTIK